MFSLLGMEACRGLLPECKEVAVVDKYVLNHFGQRMFVKTNEREPVLKGFEIVSSKFGDKQLGIHKNPKYRYVFFFSDRDDADVCNINLYRFRLYFHASGNGFLTVEAQISSIDALHVLDLGYGLTYTADIAARKSIVLSDLGENTKQKLSRYEGYYAHICWETSPDAMLFIGNMHKAESEDSLNLLTGFRENLAGTYLLLYLYYLNIYLEFKNTEEICEKIREDQGRSGDEAYNIEDLIQGIRSFRTEADKLCEEQDHEHINILFRERLCGKSFALSSSLRILREEYLPMLSSKKNHNIFISYRRESGAFDKQLFGKIDECWNVIAVISEGAWNVA